MVLNSRKYIQTFFKSLVLKLLTGGLEIHVPKALLNKLIILFKRKLPFKNVPIS